MKSEDKLRQGASAGCTSLTSFALLGRVLSRICNGILVA
jgi:hypothetical protein